MMLYLIVTLQFFLITGLWAIDIGASGMIWETATGITAQAQGLGFTREPNTHYHLGLGTVYIIFFIQLCWLLTLVLKGDLKSK